MNVDQAGDLTHYSSLLIMGVLLHSPRDVLNHLGPLLTHLSHTYCSIYRVWPDITHTDKRTLSKAFMEGSDTSLRHFHPLPLAP